MDKLAKADGVSLYGYFLRRDEDYVLRKEHKSKLEGNKSWDNRGRHGRVGM